MRNMMRLVPCVAALSLTSLVCGQETPVSRTPSQTSGATAGETAGKTDCHQAVYREKWNNKPFAAQSGVFTAEFDVTPSVAKIYSGIVISEGPTAGRSNAPILIAFEDKESRLQIRNTNHKSVNPTTNKPVTYTADREIKYTVNARHHFRVVVNVPEQTFSVYVTVPGAAEQSLAVNHKFEKAGVGKLNNIGVHVRDDMVQPEGATNTVCNLVVREGAPAAK